VTEKTYYLDLPTLVTYLQDRTAVLKTTLTLAKNQPPAQGLLFLLANKVMHGYILSPNGAVLAEGEKAQARLRECKEWRVRIDSEAVIGQEWLAWQQMHQSSKGNPSPAATGVIPVPVRSMEPHMMTLFSHQQVLFLRTVFALVNGQRTVEQIKERLPQSSSQSIEDALNVLRTLGLIR
jgi:hypothetical protein